MTIILTIIIMIIIVIIIHSHLLPALNTVWTLIHQCWSCVAVLAQTGDPQAGWCLYIYMCVCVYVVLFPMCVCSIILFGEPMAWPPRTAWHDITCWSWPLHPLSTTTMHLQMRAASMCSILSEELGMVGLGILKCGSNCGSLCENWL